VSEQPPKVNKLDEKYSLPALYTGFGFIVALVVSTPVAKSIFSSLLFITPEAVTPLNKQSVVPEAISELPYCLPILGVEVVNKDHVLLFALYFSISEVYSWVAEKPLEMYMSPPPLPVCRALDEPLRAIGLSALSTKFKCCEKALVKLAINTKIVIFLVHFYRFNFHSYSL